MMSNKSKQENDKNNRKEIKKNGTSEYNGIADIENNKGQNVNKSEEKFSSIIYLIILFMIIESIGGYLSQSLAIYCDLGHLVSDLIGYGISLYAIKFSKRNSPSCYTFGYKKAENIGALFSVFSTWMICILIMYQGFYRLYLLYNNEILEIDAFIMLISSILSLLINVIMMYSLTHDHEDILHHVAEISIEMKRVKGFDSISQSDNDKNEQLVDNKEEVAKIKDHNMNAAFIHILGDMIQSLGVVIAALTLWYHPKMIIIDPLISIVFAIIAFSFTLPITFSILRFLIDKSPDHINVDEVRSKLLLIKGVQSIHSLRLWCVSSRNIVMTCHLYVNDKQDSYVLSKAILLANRLGIDDCTFQIENINSENCTQRLQTQTSEL